MSLPPTAALPMRCAWRSSNGSSAICTSTCTSRTTSCFRKQSISRMVSESSLRQALRNVIDPELGVNIVDLGLVYGVGVADDGRVRVTMTMTSPACPLRDYLQDLVESSVT